MRDYFTSVKQYAEKSTGFISRVFTQYAKNTDSHAISPMEIRDMTFKSYGK